MNESIPPVGSSVVPCLIYQDAGKAIQWLCETFGFQKQAVYANDQGLVLHAQLTHGTGMIMLGSKMPPEHESAYSRLIRQPDQSDGFVTQSIYMQVEDADVVYRQAKAAGAAIVIDIKQESYGGRGFTCRDLEGHIWSLGTYDPWTVHDPR